MPVQRPDDSSELPSSLRSFLTVTHPDGAPRAARVEPSSLLSRMEAFLPKLKKANEALVTGNSEQGIVQLEKVAAENAANEDNYGPDDEYEENLRVNMDLYVDNNLGTLVGSGTGADAEEVNDKGAIERRKKRPLIEVLSEADSATTELAVKKLAKEDTKCAPP